MLRKLNTYSSIAGLLSGLVDVRSESISPFWPRTDRFRSSPMSGHFQIPPACPKTCTTPEVGALNQARIRVDEAVRGLNSCR